MTHAYTLPETSVSDYQRLGAVVLRGVLSAQEVEVLRQGIEHNLSDLSPLDRERTSSDQIEQVFRDGQEIIHCEV